MKSNKKSQAEHISQMTKRFNDGSRLVSSEIISRNNMQSRVAAIEKWTAVADICRCLHNFNGVLQVCAAFTNAAVFRLKKTWDKVPKTVCSHSSLTRSFYCWCIQMVYHFHSFVYRLNTPSISYRLSSALMADSEQCVKHCIAVIHRVFHIWACIWPIYHLLKKERPTLRPIGC